MTLLDFLALVFLAVIDRLAFWFGAGIGAGALLAAVGLRLVAGSERPR